MDEHFDSFLASKSDVRNKSWNACNLRFFAYIQLIRSILITFQVSQALESRIAKMSNICTSGVAILKELAETMQMKSNSSLEQMMCTISVQAASAEKVLANIFNC